MFTVEVLEKGSWKRDRKYKLFQNAEKRVDDFHQQGINARMIEVKKCDL